MRTSEGSYFDVTAAAAAAAATITYIYTLSKMRDRHVRNSEGWYVDVNMHTGGVMFPYYRSLQSFWPGTIEP